MKIVRVKHHRLRLHDASGAALLKSLKPDEPFTPFKTIEIGLVPLPGRAMALDILGDTLYFYADPNQGWTWADWAEWRKYVPVEGPPQ